MPEACNFIKKEMLAQVFSYEFCEIYKNTFFIEHLRATASEVSQNQKQQLKVFCKKGVPKNFAKSTGKRPEVSNFIKKETLTQVFSCEFCEIFKNNFCTEHLWTTASLRIAERSLT